MIIYIEFKKSLIYIKTKTFIINGIHDIYFIYTEMRKIKRMRFSKGKNNIEAVWNYKQNKQKRERYKWKERKSNISVQTEENGILESWASVDSMALQTKTSQTSGYGW